MTVHRRPEDLAARGTVETFVPPRGKRIGKLLLRSDADARLAPVRQYIVKGWMYPGELGATYGEPGSAKSFLGVHIDRCIAAGRDVFGRRVRQMHTLYCALEGEGGFENRIKAAIVHGGAVDGFAYVAQPMNLFSDATAQADLKAAILEHKAGKVTIDTMARAMAEGSENDPADMGRMIQFLDTLRAETKAHLTLIHHSGKDATRGMRGHTALLGAADLVLEVTRPEGASIRAVRVVKSKDGVDGEKFAFELRPIDLGQDDDGDAITSCVVVEAEAPADPGKRKQLTPTDKGWLDDLRNLFVEQDAAVKREPFKDFGRQILTVTREQVREHMRKVGRFGEKSDGALTGADRNKLRDRLNALKDKGVIGLTSELVWLI